MAKIDSITQYQDLACRTFKAHRELTAYEAMLLDWVIGLPGEVGEVCELIKHHIFHEEELDEMKLAKELGDVLWYISAIAKVRNIPMDSIMGLNVGKLQHRYDNGGFDKTKSEHRHAQEKKFEETEVYKELRDSIIPPLTDEHYINIVLVGNECTGKTTLAKMLSEELGMEYYKGTYREDDKLARATNLICNAENTIFDRLYFPDELVYRAVKCDPLPEEEVEAFMSLADVMRERHFLVIRLDAQIDVIKARLAKRGDDFIESHELTKISRIYDDLLPSLGLNIATLDTSATPMEDLLPEVIKAIKKFREASWAWR